MKSSTDLKGSEQHSNRHVPLVLKDGMREVRLNAKISAKKWIENFEDVFAELPRPFGKPFEIAAKVGTRMLGIADKTAISLLSTDSEFRKSDFRLPHPTTWTQGTHEEHLSNYTKPFYWSLKEILRQKNQSNYFVLEEAVYRACENFFRLADQHRSADKLTNAPSTSSLMSALLIQCLYEARPIAYRRTLTIEDTDIIEATATLSVFACAGVVIAAEIAEVFSRVPSSEETRAALLLADEVTAARLRQLDMALHSNLPVRSLAVELDFLIRHI